MSQAHLIPLDLLRKVLMYRTAARPPDPHFVLNAGGCQVGQGRVCRNRVDNILVGLEGTDDGTGSGIPYIHPSVVTACRPDVVTILGQGCHSGMNNKQCNWSLMVANDLKL